MSGILSLCMLSKRGLFALLVLLFASSSLGAAEPAAGACPTPATERAGGSGDHRPVRRLRAALATSPEVGGIEFDMAELSFVTSTTPNPLVQDVVQVPGDGRTALKVTVVNNSRHASPDGGITLSFPELTRPTDRSRIEDVRVPEGMALHVIPAGGQLFGRNGLPQVARHLMIEVHGPWQPRQSRTLEIQLRAAEAPLLVHYRSALSDEDNNYRNAPAQSGRLDQQGWPAMACSIGATEAAGT